MTPGAWPGINHCGILEAMVEARELGFLIIMYHSVV